MEKSYKIILRIEIDTLFDDHGKLSLKKMEHLAMVCTNLHNAGLQVLIVSSGAILLGAEKMGLSEPPTELILKQAIAAIGQADLMKFYQMFFDSFDQIVAQVLITRDVIRNPDRNKNARMTLIRLLEKGIIPIINENDSVSTDDIILNDNYPLTLIVAQLVRPHAIVIKSAKENQYRVVVKNNPEILTLSEEKLFTLANKLRTQGAIAEDINFDCKTQQPENGLESQFVDDANGFSAIARASGFPEVITES